MDKKALIVLRADVKGQMDLIDDVFTKLTARAVDLQADDEVQLESTAYQMHNLYSAVEDLFKLIASQFENQVADVSRWHIQLLQCMKQEIPGVRPALISPETFILLNGLRSFRHFFRHAYTAPIEFDQLQINLDKAQQVHSSLHKDVSLFLERIGV
jgi:hypothetical protein